MIEQIGFAFHIYGILFAGALCVDYNKESCTNFNLTYILLLSLLMIFIWLQYKSQT